MKVSINLLSLVLLVSFAVTALARGQVTTKPITINRESKVGTQSIGEGDYTIRFREDQAGDLVFLKGSREVAKASYETTKLSEAAEDTTVVYKLASDGSLQISRIEFRGSDVALALK